jgi:hypothetical protein
MPFHTISFGSVTAETEADIVVVGDETRKSIINTLTGWPRALAYRAVFPCVSV